MVKNVFRIVSAFLMISLINIGFGQDKTWHLKECIDSAWEKNISIQKAELNLQNANYDLDYNKAQYHPNLNANYTNGFNWGRTIDPTTYQFVNGQVTTNNVGISGSIVLFDGFTTPSRIKQSRVGVDLASGQIETQKNFIAISIASAYLQILLAYEKLELTSNQLIATRSLLILTQKYFENDLKSESEVMQISAQVAKEEADSIAANNTLVLAKLSLLQLMEEPYSVEFNINRFDPEIIQAFAPIPNSEVLYDSALNVVPEILNAKLNLQMAELDLRAVKGSYYPKLSLNGSVGTNYASSSKIVNQEVIIEEKPIGYLVSDPAQIVNGTEVTVNPIFTDYSYFSQFDDNLSSSVSINLAIPIYNRKQVIVSQQKSEVNINRAQLDLQNEKNLLRKDIESDYLEYVLLSQQLVASKKMLEAYQISYDKTQKLYELDMISTYELLVEKNKIWAAESDVVQLQYQQLFKYIILRYYLTGEIDLPIE